MASYYFGINVGDNEYEAAGQATDPTKEVEIVIPDTTKVATVEQLLIAIENLRNVILRNGKAW
jgi:hypothetical protein